MELKEINEKIGALEKELKGIPEKAKAEKRGVTKEEETRFDALSAELESLRATARLEQRAESLLGDRETKTDEPKPETRSSKDILADYCRGKELRAGEMTTTSTGGIIPSDFSKDIIKKVRELCGIMSRISVVNSKGTYKQIIRDENNLVSAGWTDEIAEITSSEAKFTTIEIGHHKLAALVKLSLELINQNEFDIVSEVLGQMTDDFALKAEQGIISGDGSGKPYGLVTSGTAYTLAAPAVTSDDLVKIFHTLKAPYQTNAAWLMNNNTLCGIRLIKDGNGQYMFHQSEMTGGYVGTILGKPVMLTECADSIAAGKSPILFGDYSRAYKANLNPSMTIQRLDEKYAEFGMKGYVGILWLDGRPVNPEAYVNVKVAE